MKRIFFTAGFLAAVVGSVGATYAEGEEEQVVDAGDAAVRSARVEAPPLQFAITDAYASGHDVYITYTNTVSRATIVELSAVIAGVGGVEKVVVLQQEATAVGKLDFRVPPEWFSGSAPNLMNLRLRLRAADTRASQHIAGVAFVLTTQQAILPIGEPGSEPEESGGLPGFYVINGKIDHDDGPGGL